MELSKKQAEAALHKIQLEKVKALRRELWRKDPLVWYEERFGEKIENFAWSQLPGYDGHEWDGDIDPLVNAWRDLGNGVRKVGIESATGTGKTFWLARIVFWFLDCYPNSLVVTSAPKEDQLTLNLWSEISREIHKFKKFRPEMEFSSLKLRVEGSGKDLDDDEADLSKSWIAVGFVAGSGANEESTNKARGFHRKDMLIILEECPGMSSAVLNAFKNTSVANNNLMLAVGNPDSQLDPLHQFCELDDCNSYRISAYDHPNVVLKEEVIPGAVTQVSLDSRKKEYGENSPLYRAMGRGISPAEATDSLIKLEWIKTAFETELGRGNWPNALGIDVANSVDGDKACLAWGKGAILSQAHEFQCDNATHLAYNVILSNEGLLERSYKNYSTRKIYEEQIAAEYIGIDAVGVGVATVNAFVDEKLYGIQSLQGGVWSEAIPLDQQTKKPLYSFANLRTQMWWEMREDLRKGQVSFREIHEVDPDTARALAKELITPKYTVSDRTIHLESKEKIKKRLSGKSPNRADAVVYWNWTRKGYRAGTGMFGIHGGPGQGEG